MQRDTYFETKYVIQMVETPELEQKVGGKKRIMCTLCCSTRTWVCRRFLFKGPSAICQRTFSRPIKTTDVHCLCEQQQICDVSPSVGVCLWVWMLCRPLVYESVQSVLFSTSYAYPLFIPLMPILKFSVLLLGNDPRFSISSPKRSPHFC